LKAFSPKLPTPAEVAAEWAARAESSLATFFRRAWPVLEPGKAYLHNWHIDAIAEYLEAVSAGQILRLIINVPPRTGKSTMVTIEWPAWVWLRRPAARWLFASYSQSLSEMHSVARRTLLQSDWYQAAWADRFRLADDENLKREYRNDHRGAMVATSIGGTVTGKGGDVIVVDDPHNPKTAESDVERATTIRDFDLTFSTRLDDPATGAIVLVMQRLHEEDLTAHCLAQGYTHLNLPAEAEARTVITFPRSARQVVRAPGDLLWPGRLSAEVLAGLKVALGSYGYAGQMQQRPAPAEGGKLKRTWWRFWHYPGHPLPDVLVPLGDGGVHRCPVVPLPDAFDQTLQSWDMAFKAAEDTDYVVGQIWSQLGADCFLRDQVRDRWDLPATLTAVRSLTTAWPSARTKLVEDKANGPAVISTLRREIGGLVAVEPEGGKIVRVAAVSPYIEAGNVYLPHPLIAPWVDGFLNECAAFPNGAHDDQVDPMTQALVRLTARREPEQPDPEESIW